MDIHTLYDALRPFADRYEQHKKDHGYYPNDTTQIMVKCSDFRKAHETVSIDVLECPGCGCRFSRDHLKAIEDETCPYCKFNYEASHRIADINDG